MLRHVIVYTNYYKDEVLTKLDLTTVNELKIVDDLIRTGYDVLITHKDHKEGITNNYD